MYTPEEIKIANSTYRNTSTVGEKAVVPQIIKRQFTPKENLRILDFGAGKAAAHKLSLEKEGYNVDAYNFGENTVQGLHIDGPLTSNTYDVIYASNVLNVQSSLGMLEETLDEIKNTLKPAGIAIANYPASPRKLGYSVDMISQVLENSFHVERIKFKKNIIFELKK